MARCRVSVRGDELPKDVSPRGEQIWGHTPTVCLTVVAASSYLAEGLSQKTSLLGRIRQVNCCPPERSTGHPPGIYTFPPRKGGGVITAVSVAAAIVLSSTSKVQT